MSYIKINRDYCENYISRKKDSQINKNYEYLNRERKIDR